MNHTYRTLSSMLTDTLTEAKLLLNLKAEFGRMPPTLKNYADSKIDEWFCAYGDPMPNKPLQTTSKSTSEPVNPIGNVKVRQSPHSGFTFQDKSDGGTNRVDNVPVDDEIPF